MKCSKLEEGIEVLKDENNECLKDIINNISKNKKDQLIAHTRTQLDQLEIKEN
ncbi:7507_t:CDS:2 [Funneliformis caledonium]|uniref:7507_t:CDS:1 n=1 Tax=Funneliformis caledonium TaxID=1117310 RepID=A0A9N8VAE0_9GLOM|nr:7507_t:CDS:2 [Funneliformis caledonium]